MLFPIEIELQTDGSVIRAIQRVTPIITLILLRGWFAPSMLTVTLDPTHPHLLTLLIRCDHLPSLMEELNTSFSRGESRLENPYGDG